MRIWYLLVVFSKISDEHPRHFYRGVPPSQLLADLTLLRNPFPVVRDQRDKTSCHRRKSYNNNLTAIQNSVKHVTVLL